VPRAPLDFIESKIRPVPCFEELRCRFITFVHVPRFIGSSDEVGFSKKRRAIAAFGEDLREGRAREWIGCDADGIGTV